MKTNQLILASLILIVLHIVLTTIFSCGIINKQKSTSNSEVRSHIKSEESMEEKSSLQFLEWHKIWMQESEFSTAFIQSDSAIVYQPGLGFQLTRGTVFLAKAKQGETRYEDSIFENHEKSSSIAQNIDYLQEDQFYSKSSEKERRPFNWMYKIIVISLAIIVLWLVYRLR